MATRSNIAIRETDGSFLYIYSHWDGYPSHHGPLLLTHYNTEEKARLLVSHGDVSILDTRSEPTGKHTFDAPEKGTTVYYGRDRGETGTEPRKLDAGADPLQNEYVYVFDVATQAWLWAPAYGDKKGPLRPLTFDDCKD